MNRWAEKFEGGQNPGIRLVSGMGAYVGLQSACPFERLCTPPPNLWKGHIGTYGFLKNFHQNSHVPEVVFDPHPKPEKKVPSGFRHVPL